MSNDQDVFVALSRELKQTVEHLDKSMDELAAATQKTTEGLRTLSDLAERIRRNIEDPPAERHTLEVHDGAHGAEAEFPDTEPS